ncbi:MAG: YcaO-like family protein [Bdellovibrionales bacterium]|nr:YcaO-like family protein [Bdellovibrionales bacterium]
MRSFLAEISAVFNSRKIVSFVDGTSATLPDGDSVVIKVKNTNRVQRSLGLRFAKYSYVTEVMAGDEIGFGYGESESQLLSFQKSIVEGVERAIYRQIKKRSPLISNSNGWAAHASIELARTSAVEELCERDAILAHWLCQHPFTEVEPASFPQWIREWTERDLKLHPQFNRLRILLTEIGYIPVAMTVLQGEDGRALISQATASTVDVAVYKALSETCRIGEIALAREFWESSQRLAQNQPLTEGKYLPEDHAMVYAYHLAVPEWVFGQPKTWQVGACEWIKKYKIFRSKPVSATFHPVISGPIVVGYCVSESVQNLFFGRTTDATEDGSINLRRLETVRQKEPLYLLPHCVP